MPSMDKHQESEVPFFFIASWGMLDRGLTSLLHVDSVASVQMTAIHACVLHEQVRVVETCTRESKRQMLPFSDVLCIISPAVRKRLVG